MGHTLGSGRFVTNHLEVIMLKNVFTEFTLKYSNVLLFTKPHSRKISCFDIYALITATVVFAVHYSLFIFRHHLFLKGNNGLYCTIKNYNNQQTTYQILSGLLLYSVTV